MITKHFAVLGTTGVGKSSGVALILSGIMQERPDVRIFVLDAHNEYGRCFGDRAKITNPRNLKLPFWFFNFEEIVDVFFGGRLGVDEEIDILAELIPLAKASMASTAASSARSPSGPKRATASTRSTDRRPIASPISSPSWTSGWGSSRTAPPGCSTTG